MNLLLWGLIGFGALMIAKKNQGAAPLPPGQNPGKYNPSQPSQKYPFKMTQPRRADNANQPWYNGPKVNAGPADQVTAVSVLQQGATVIHSMSDIWGTMSDLFQGNSDAPSTDDPKQNLSSVDSLPADNVAIAGGADMGSNIVGDAANMAFADPSGPAYDA